MPFYLSPYVLSGNGRGGRRCVPVGSDQPGWSAIDLRADGGATLGGNGLNVCLLWLPVADSDARLDLLADAKDETLALATRNRLRSKLGLSVVRPGRFAAAVVDLLVDPPTNGWKPIREGRGGAIEIHLGGVLWHATAIRGGASITESFNKSDNGLGPDLTWTTFSGSGAGVLSNEAYASGVETLNRADADLATDDHSAQAETGVGYTTGVVYIGVLCRKDSSGTLTFYRWSNFGTDGGWELVKFVGGTETALDTGYTTDPVAGESFKIDANGSTIRGFHPATTQRASVTDTAITGNLRCGIHMRNNGASSFGLIDNFAAADLSVSGLSVSVSDSLTVEEFARPLVLSVAGVADSVTVTESVTLGGLGFPVTAADAVTVTESVSIFLNPRSVSVSDAVTVSEVVEVLGLALQIEAIETLTVSESVLATPAPLFVVVSEAVTVAEADVVAIAGLPPTISVADSVTVAESVDVQPILTIEQDIILTEQLSLALLIDVSDAVTVTEAQTLRVNPLRPSPADAITVTEALTIASLGLVPSRSDAITVTDAVTVVLAFQAIDVADSVTVTEAVSVQEATTSLDVSDNLTVSEEVALLITPLAPAVTDAVTVAEAVTVSFLANLFPNVAEAVTVTESVTISPLGRSIGVADAVAVAEFAFTQAPFQRIDVGDAVGVVDEMLTQLSGQMAGAANAWAATNRRRQRA